jgi:hypothetical protein
VLFPKSWYIIHAFLFLFGAIYVTGCVLSEPRFFVSQISKTENHRKTRASKLGEFIEIEK